MLVRILDELVSFCKQAHVLLCGLCKDGSCLTSSHYYKGGRRLDTEKSLGQPFTRYLHTVKQTPLLLV